MMRVAGGGWWLVCGGWWVLGGGWWSHVVVAGARLAGRGGRATSRSKAISRIKDDGASVMVVAVMAGVVIIIIIIITAIKK
jgi:hypothetical protein